MWIQQKSKPTQLSQRWRIHTKLCILPFHLMTTSGQTIEFQEKFIQRQPQVLCRSALLVLFTIFFISLLKLFKQFHLQQILLLSTCFLKSSYNNNNVFFWTTFSNLCRLPNFAGKKVIVEITLLHVKMWKVTPLSFLALLKIIFSGVYSRWNQNRINSDHKQT